MLGPICVIEEVVCLEVGGTCRAIRAWRAHTSPLPSCCRRQRLKRDQQRHSHANATLRNMQELAECLALAAGPGSSQPVSSQQCLSSSCGRTMWPPHGPVDSDDAAIHHPFVTDEPDEPGCRAKKLSFFKKIELDRDSAVTNSVFFVTVLAFPWFHSRDKSPRASAVIHPVAICAAWPCGAARRALRSG